MEMIEEWYDRPPGTSAVQLAAKSAQWGADQELEACCEWTREYFGWNRSIQDADQLRSARRPKPPSLKEQALTALRDSPVDPVDEMLQLSADVELIIRRALEALDD
jgi:hypothetical protein